MQSVPHLFAGTVESDVAQRAMSQVGVDPIGKDSLVRCAELPRSSQDTASIDPDRQVKRLAVFKSDYLRGKFSAPIEGDGSACAEVDVDSFL